MNPVGRTLTAILREQIIKAAEQASMFGSVKDNPDLVPQKKVVRRKGGGTHVQTFYTRKDERPPARQTGMFDAPPAAPAPAPAERPSVLDALRAPEKRARRPKQPPTPPTGGMFDQPAPAAPQEPTPRAAQPAATPAADVMLRVQDLTDHFLGMIEDLTGERPSYLPVKATGLPGRYTLGGRKWPALYDQFLSHMRRAKHGNPSATAGSMAGRSRNADAMAALDDAERVLRDMRAMLDARGTHDAPENPPEATPAPAAGAMPEALRAYLDRLKVPARRKFAEAVIAELRGGPRAEDEIELTDSSAGSGEDMMRKIRAKVQRFAGASTPAAAPTAPAPADKSHYQAPAAPDGIQPFDQQNDKTGRLAVKVLDAIGQAGGMNLLDTLSRATDYHLRIEPPVKGLQPLVIEKHGRDIMLTHYRDQGGDRILDSEAIFRVDDYGQVTLHQTAVEDPFRGGENRGHDPTFARMMLHHMIEDGYTTTGREHWAGRDAPEKPDAEPTPNAGAFDDAGWTISYGSTNIHDGLKTPEKPEGTPTGAPKGLADALNGDAEAAEKVHAAILGVLRPDWQDHLMRSREVMNAIAGALGANRASPGDRLTVAYHYARNAPEYGAPNGDPGIEVHPDNLVGATEGDTRTENGVTYVLRRSNDGAGPLRWFAQAPPDFGDPEHRAELARQVEEARAKHEAEGADGSLDATGYDNDVGDKRVFEGGRMYELRLRPDGSGPPRWYPAQEGSPEPERNESAPAGAGYQEDAFEEYRRQGGRTRDRVDPSTQHVYASTLRPLGSFAPQLMKLVTDGSAEVMNRGMRTVKRDERAHAYVFSSAPLDPEVASAYQLTLVHQPPAEASTAKPDARDAASIREDLRQAKAEHTRQQAEAVRYGSMGGSEAPALARKIAALEAELAAATPDEPPADEAPAAPAGPIDLTLAGRVRAALNSDPNLAALVRNNVTGGNVPLVRDVIVKEAEKAGAHFFNTNPTAHLREYKNFADGGAEAIADDFIRQHAAKPAAKPTAPRAARTRSFGFDAVPRAKRQAWEKARKAANLRAIDIAKALDAEDRPATDDEREALAAYTGDGGLTGDLNAHYTPTALASAMWDALRAAGFEGGRVLEPSMGAGVFLHTAPDGVTMTGVEYSSTTGSIAKHLHEPAGHTVHGGMPFEQYNVTSTDEPFDAIIANPPYGVRGATVALDKPEFAAAEEYFIDATLDRLKDGGLAAFLINDGPFTRGGSADFRRRLLARADVLTLKQLPSATFKDSNSGVPPVVLVLRKRPHEQGLTLARLAERHGDDVLKAAGAYHESILEGTHFTPDSGNILGDWDGESRTYSRHKDVKGDLTPERLAALSTDLREPATINLARVRDLVSDDELASAIAYASGRGSGRLPDGTISEDGRYILRVGESGERRWHKIEEEQPTIAASLDVSRGLKEFVHVRNNALDRGEAEQHRVRSLAAVQAYLEAHGNPHDDPAVKALAKQRHELAHLLALVNPDGTIKPALTTPLADDARAETLDTSDPEHIAQHLYRAGKLTPRNLLVWAQANDATGIRTTEDARALLEEHYALEPSGRWTTASEFYTGHVLDKADLMDATAQRAGSEDDASTYRRQAARLRALVPTASADSFRATARDHFVPPHVIAAFLNDYFADGEDAFEVTRENGVVYARAISRYYGGGDFEDFQKYLNYALTPEAVRHQADKTRSEIAAERQAGQARALDQQAQYDEAFGTWLLSSPHREEVEREYTRRVLGYIEPTISGDALPLREWTGPTLHEYQNQAVRHALAAGNSIMALDVGLGKTHAGAALAGMLLQEGRAKRPMVVVPKSLLANWRRHLPNDLKGRKVLLVGETEQPDGSFREDDGVRVAQKLIDAATGDYDAVLITRDWYGRIPIREDNFSRLVGDDLEAKRIAQLEAEDGEDAYRGQGRRRSAAKKKKTKRDELSEEEKHAQKAATKKFLDTLAGLNFEDLGIDALIVDEAQAYKNLHAAPRVIGASPKFMGGSAESKRAQDFLHKSILTRERSGGSNVYFLTATPTKNSPLELFNMLKHLDHQALINMGIPYTDAFVDRYCAVTTGLTMSMTGQDLEPRPMVAGFRNLRELRGIMRQYVFRRTGADADIVRQMGGLPEMRDEHHEISMDDDIRDEYRALAAAAKDAASQRGASGDEHAFSYLSRMQKLTLDPALHDSAYADRPNPRFIKAGEIASRALSEGGKVVMFMDIGKQAGDDTGDGADALDGMDADDLRALLEEYNLDPGTPAKKAKAMLRKLLDADATNAYDRLVQNLVNAGVPREQIAVVTADTAKSSSARDDIKNAYNRGDIKVIIGSTGVIGEGFSLQRGTTDMVHLDMPWDPGTYKQRLGRTVRQGNKQPFVRNHVLSVRGTFDSLRLATLKGKSSWTEQLWDGDADEVENPEAATQAIMQMAANLTEDPAAAQAAISEYMKEQNQRAADARVTIAKRAVETHAVRVTAVLARRARLQATKDDIKELEDREARGYLGSGDKDKLARMRKRLPLMEAAVQRGIEEARVAAKKFADDPDLPADLREVIASGKPFLMDPQQRPIAIGSIINLGDDTFEVTGIDGARRRIDIAHVSIVGGRGSSRGMNIADLGPDHEVTLTRAPELTRTLITQQVRSQPVLAHLDPAIAAEHADAVQQALRGANLRRAWLINERTGSVRLATHSKGVEPDRGERFLVNTPEDFAAFTRAYPTPTALRESDDGDGRWSIPFEEHWTQDGRVFKPPKATTAKAANVRLADALTRALAKLGITMEA